MFFLGSMAVMLGLSLVSIGVFLMIRGGGLLIPLGMCMCVVVGALAAVWLYVCLWVTWPPKGGA